MEARPREIRFYETRDGKVPFAEWLEGFEGQKKLYGIFIRRIDRVENGLFGDCEPVGEGVSELRIDFGPGYRIYFGQDGDVVWLLNGGDKSTQAKNINTAKQLWRDHNAKH